jgi:antitoxin ParD1/3/4
MNVSLTPELESIINKKVSSGMYHSASEVIREGLRLLQEKDALREIRLKELRKEISIGLKQADRGELEPFDINEIKAEARRRFAKQRKSN